MKHFNHIFPLCLIALCGAVFSACSDDEEISNAAATLPAPDGSGETNTPEWVKIETYSGGEAGTAFDRTSLAFEQPMPAVEELGLLSQFKRGERMFEANFVSGHSSETSYSGLGPVYIRTSCIACHPGYGRSYRVDKFNSFEDGNGYLLTLCDENWKPLPQFTGMLQTRAVEPYKAPFDESGLTIEWRTTTDEHGNTFPDGETYVLRYPVVTVDKSKILLQDNLPEVVNCNIEGTIGIPGTGLLDAIPDDSIRVQYEREVARGYCVPLPLNTIVEEDGNAYLGRWTYGHPRPWLGNGPGANAIWNITNVNRSDRRYLYATKEWVAKMEEMGLPVDGFDVAPGATNSLEAEMDNDDYQAFMVWHRGLAIPAARNLDQPEVQRGREVFYELGCQACHRPSWTTGNAADAMRRIPKLEGEAGKQLAEKLANQTVWPYTDFLKHNLDLLGGGMRANACRTTPLWGKGLQTICTGRDDKMHDLRASSYEEAIMWHGHSPKSDSYKSAQKFWALPTADRKALVRFLESI